MTRNSGDREGFSLRAKLIVIGLTTTGAALLVAGGAFLVYDQVSFRKATLARFEILGGIVAEQSAAAVAFNDRPALQATLGTLRSEPQVVGAAVYALDGRLLAFTGRDPGPRPSWGTSNGLSGRRLRLTRPILQERRAIGVLALECDLRELRTHLQKGIQTVLIVLAAALLASLLLSLKLSGDLLRPIFRLASAVQVVSAEKNYAVRVPPGNGDEMSLLIRGFNEMLSGIRERDDALVQAREGLENRIVERTREIQALNDRLRRRSAELESANEELESFAYSVSHDLKAPLRSIAGYSSLLAEGYGEKLGEEGQQYLERMIGSSRRMAELIDALLSLARLTRPEVRRQSLDLTEIARTIVEEWRVREPNRRVRAEIAEGIRAEADPQLVRALLENLIANAWKFTRQREEGRIEIGTVAKDGRRAFFVRDNGAGFDMAYADKLFRLFQRLHRADEFDGMGIGLATVQRIVRRHGGQVWAEGAVGRGATFYFTLGEPPPTGPV
jgi:signal transduction histidine kinase